MNHVNQTGIPAFTLHNYRISVNTACIKSFPEFDYVRIIINPAEKKLVVYPCQEDNKNTLRWRSASAQKSPRKILCRIFCAKVLFLMNWNPHSRYKILGSLIHSKGERFFVFDLNNYEVHEPKTDNGIPFIKPEAVNGYTVFFLQEGAAE